MYGNTIVNILCLEIKKMMMMIDDDSCGGLMVSTQVCQSEGSGFKSRSGQMAYFHVVNVCIV